MPDSPDSALVGNMSPYERISAYRAPRRGFWRRWFAAALPWMFVICVAAGTMLPVRRLGAAVAAERGRQPGGARCRDDLEAGRKSGHASRRRRDPHHRWRHVRGAGSSGAGSRSDNTRVRLRGIDAPELKASCRAGIADGGGRDGRVARLARRRRRHDLQYRAGQICRPRRRRRRDAAHRKCFDGDARRGSCPQLRRRPSQRLVRERRTTPLKRKSRAIARLLYQSDPCDQCVTVTVVPTETR